MILWKTANGDRPYGTTTREINFNPWAPVERAISERGMKTVDQMSEDELIAAIQQLQAVRVPSSKPKTPKRLDDRPKKDPSKRTWRDELFGE